MPNQTQANGLPRDGEEFREWDEDAPTITTTSGTIAYNPEVMNSITGTSLTNMWSDDVFETGPVSRTHRITASTVSGAPPSRAPVWENHFIIPPPRPAEPPRVRPGAPTRTPLDDLSVRQAQARAARSMPEPHWVTARRNAEQAERDEQRRISERLEAEALRQRTAAMASEVDRATINTIMGGATVGTSTTSSWPDQVRYVPTSPVIVDHGVNIPMSQLHEWYNRLRRANYNELDSDVQQVMNQMQRHLL